MAKIEFRYELSQEADNDLVDIFDYSTAQFGTDQAIKYLNELDQVFQLLCDNPKLGRPRNEIRKELRSITHQSHVVFYRILKDHIRIVRVLHASRDVVKFLPGA